MASSCKIRLVDDDIDVPLESTGACAGLLRLPHVRGSERHEVMRPLAQSYGPPLAAAP
jgi:hypothetical protein